MQSDLVDPESRSNLKGHQLLDQKFACVGDAYLANGLGALANSAFKLLLSEVCLADQTTCLTDVHLVAIRDIEKPLFQESSSTVGNHAVTLHLSESESSVTTSTFSWLSCQDLGRTSPS